MEVITAILPWEPVQFMTIGDIQYDGPNGAADLNRLSRAVAWGVKQPNLRFIGMGDYSDFSSTSEREALTSSKIHRSSRRTLERGAELLERELFEVLEPTKDKWVLMMQGHHYTEHLDGTTTDTRLASALGAPFGGDCAITRMTFRDPAGGSSVLKMYTHHGAGGSGVLPTAALNKLYHQKVGFPNVRIFMQGHVPALGHVSTDGLDVTDRGEPHVIHEDTHYVVTGGYARSYQQGSSYAGRAQGSYGEKAMFRPGSMGSALLTLTPEHIHSHNTSYRTVDIKVTV
jgi:hypothetical protein